MKKIIAIITLIFCALQTQSLFAQDEVDTSFNTRMNYVFGVLEKNRVPNGMLLDYAMEFTNLKAFNGVALVDSNYTDYVTLGDIYNTLITSKIHTNATGLISPNIWDSLWFTQRQDGIITLSGVFFNYARFRDDVVSGGFITISNDKFVDRYIGGVWQNPYITEKVFAITPSTDYYEGKNLQVILPTNLWFSNSGISVSNASVHISDGLGYRALTLGQALSVNYSDTGRKEWKFKLTLTTGEILYSHSSVLIKADPYTSASSQSRGIPQTFPFTATQSYLGKAAQGFATVDYASLTDRVVRRPLIVAEGFDAGHILHPERWFGSQSLKNFKTAIDNSGSDLIYNLLGTDINQYDIIYIDWKIGTDYIERNALLLEDIIRNVNLYKQPFNGVLQPIVIIGESMGGLIARAALKDMENKGENTGTRLFVSYDSPQLGANVPLGYQYMARHAKSLYIRSGVFPIFELVQLIRNRVSPIKALNISNTPAAREMLINWVNDNNQVDNTFHQQWQNLIGPFGYPNQNGIRVVAVSNGSECAITQPFTPGGLLFDYTGKANTRFLSDLILSSTALGNAALAITSFATGQPAFLLGILPGKNEIKFEFKVNAQPLGTSDRLYKGYVTYKKTWLWAIPVQVTITNKNYYANPSILPYDYYPGGQISTDLDVQSSSVKNWFIKYNIIASHTPTFCFVPVASALDIGLGAVALTNTDYLTRYIGAAPPAIPKNTPFQNFITAYNSVANNEQHVDILQRNGNWLANEITAAAGGPFPQSNCSFLCSNSNITITGAGIICSTPLQYTLNNAPAGTGINISWTSFPAGLVTVVAAADGRSATVTRTGSGKVTIQATISSSPCGSLVVNSASTRVGGYSSGDYIISGPSSACKNTNVNFSTNILPAATSYTWFWPSSWTNASGQGTPNLSVRTSTTSGTVGVKVGNACDAGGSPSIIFVNVNTLCGNSFSVAPNPVTDNVTITGNEPESTVLAKTSTAGNSKVSSFTKISLYDKIGNLMKEYNYAKGTTQTKLDLSIFTPDIYIIKIFDGTNWEEHKIIVSH